MADIADAATPEALPPELAIPQVKAGRFHHGDLRTSMLAQASRMIAGSGDTAFSLRDLARALGVTHAATYRHFASKADLLAGLATRGWARLDAVVAETVASAEPGEEPTETLRRIGERYSAFARANPGPYRAMHLRELRYPPLHAELEAAAATVESRIVDVIEAGQAAGTLRRDIAAVDQGRGFCEALHGVIISAIDHCRSEIDAEGSVERLLELLCSGLKPVRRPSTPSPVADRRAPRKPRAEPMTLDLFG